MTADRQSWRLAARYLLLLGACVIALYPLVGVVLASVHPPNQGAFAIPDKLDFENFGRAWHEAQFDLFMRTSTIVAIAVTAMAGTLSVLAGYAFGIFRFRGSSLLFYLFVAGLVMPAEAIVIPLYFEFRDIQLTDTYWSMILPEAGLYIAFGSFWMRAFFRSVPRSLVDASRIDGASSWTLLYRVLLPLARPQIVTMLLLFFLWSWNEFLLPLVMTSSNPALQTLPVGLAFFQGERTTDFSGLAAGSLLVIGPVVLLYVILHRQFARGMLSGAVKG